MKLPTDYEIGRIVFKHYPSESDSDILKRIVCSPVIDDLIGKIKEMNHEDRWLCPKCYITLSRTVKSSSEHLITYLCVCDKCGYEKTELI